MDLDSLRKRCLQGETFQYLLFWGHQPSTDGTVSKSCLSQFYTAPFSIDGICYPTAEHWMMAGKARLFGDLETLEEILKATEPKTAKALGRKVRGFDDQLWKANARRIVTEGNLAKFGQNESLKAFLIGTGSQVLVEASPSDRIWGIGLGASDPRANDPATWLGTNLLGFALMDVREALARS